MKLCIDCAHCYDSNRCAFRNLSPIDGTRGTGSWRDSCSLQREDGLFAAFILKTCGKRGRFWTPKPRTVRGLYDCIDAAAH